MLDLDLDLEADLGIDTVKQAEMFAAIRGAFNIARDQNLKLRDFPTLAHVIQFAQDRQPQAEPRAATPAKELHPISVAPKIRPELASFDAANAVPRRVPFPVLRPPLSMCKGTGVRLERRSRVIVMEDLGGVGDAVSEQLRAMDVEVLQLRTAMSAKAVEDLVDTWLSRGTVQGVYWLPALDEEGSLTTASLSTVHEALRVRVKLLYGLMRELYDKVATAGTFLISGSRLGGQHGYDLAGATAPLGGAVTGFTKAYKHEHLDATVKTIDFEREMQPTEIATLLIQESLLDPAAIEIGYKHGVRWTVGMREEPAADRLDGMKLDEDSVFVVTGAAGSIVSAITADLAAASGGTFYLLDIAPQPDEQNPDLERFVPTRTLSNEISSPEYRLAVSVPHLLL